MTVPGYVTQYGALGTVRRCTTASLHRCTRRTLLRTPATMAAASLLSYLLPTSAEVTAELAELAANIPGLGQADVYYPTFFLGSWLVTRTLYSVEDTVKTAIPANDRVMGIDAINSLRGRLGIPQVSMHNSHPCSRRTNRNRRLSPSDSSSIEVMWSKTEHSICKCYLLCFIA